MLRPRPKKFPALYLLSVRLLYLLRGASTRGSRVSRGGGLGGVGGAQGRFGADRRGVGGQKTQQCSAPSLAIRGAGRSGGCESVNLTLNINVSGGCPPAIMRSAQTGPACRCVAASTVATLHTTDRFDSNCCPLALCSLGVLYNTVLQESSLQKK